jgi:alkylation response protein AidB-like acyl-CoA dehydrogenase
MDIELTDDQVALRDAVRDVVGKECSPAFVRAVIDEGADPTPWWETMVGLDWPGLAVPEEFGGVGLGWIELMIVLEELGRANDPSPYLATTAMFAPAILHGGDTAQRAEWLGRVTGSGLIGALAHGCGPHASGRVQAHPDGEGWRLDGSVSNVVDGDRAGAIAVVAIGPEGPAVFVVDGAAPGVSATPTTSFDFAVHTADLTFESVAVGADRRLAGADGIDHAVEVATLAWAASTVGACQRIVEMTVEYAKERHQFGVPIGSFQAVKHKAVDMYVAVERARAICQYAALALDAGDRQLPGVSMAKAAAGECQQVVIRNGIQLFGGIGFTWENDLQISVRRAALGEVLLGGAVSHRRRVATTVRVLPAFPLPEAFDNVRTEFCSWLDDHLPPLEATTMRSRSSADIPPWAAEFQRAMFDAGWLLPGHPPELGGRNAPLLAQFAIQAELLTRKVYRSFNPQGLGIIAPSILLFGNEEQKRRWAVPILRAEITAALGMSEPNAGSDLAGLRTRALLDGDRFIVNGQKVWTSGAHDADVILTFVRTDPDAPKHRGISALLVPTDLPGLTRRPFGSITSRDDFDFNEVFFDDVEVPAANLVGELHQGWRVATGALGEERAMLWLDQYERLEDMVHNFGRAADGTGALDDHVTQNWFGKVIIDATALWVLGYRAIVASSQGRQVAQQSILKLLGSEAGQEAAMYAFESLGPDLVLDPHGSSAPFAPYFLDVFGQSWFYRYLRSFSGTIAGGTSEIQRNIVGEHVLGLPR